MHSILQKTPKCVVAFFLLLTFLSALFVAFTHMGAPTGTSGQLTTCPYAQLEGSCVSGIGHHVELSQHLTNILPGILLVFSLALLFAYRLRTPTIALFNIESIRTAKNISHIFPFLQALFACGILHPKKY